MNEEWTVKAVDGEEVKTPQEKERAVVEEAAADNPNVEVQTESDVIKVNLDEPIKQEQDAEQGNQEGDLKEESAEEEAKPESETQEGEQLREDKSETQEEEQVIELVSQEEPEAEKEVAIQEEAPKVELPEHNLPENVDKLVQFMEETGGTLEDYVNLNKDIDSMNNVDMVSEYYKEKYPHYNQERLERRMTKDFGFSEDDDPDVIQDKKDSFEDTLFEAKRYLTDRKSKYYDDLKFNRQSELAPEQKEAIDFYTDYKKSQEENNKLNETFLQQTNKVFGEDFKGFDFKVGDNKYRFKVSDVSKVKDYQSDLNNFIGEFAGEDGTITDAAGYHKAIFAAKNADKIAQHFYEQGRAEAIKNNAAKSKNIDMSPRGDAASMVQTKSGTQVRVVSGNSSNGLKFKMRK